MNSNRDGDNAISGNASSNDELEVVDRLAALLNIGLDKRCLSILIHLIREGVHPESLVDSKQNYVNVILLTLSYLV